jgi:hypothetical protein
MPLICDSSVRARSSTCVQRLRALGWVEGRNVAIEYRWAEGRFDRLAGFAAEFVRQEVDIIVAEATVALTMSTMRPVFLRSLPILRASVMAILAFRRLSAGFQAARAAIGCPWITSGV